MGGRCVNDGEEARVGQPVIHARGTHSVNCEEEEDWSQGRVQVGEGKVEGTAQGSQQEVDHIRLFEAQTFIDEAGKNVTCHLAKGCDYGVCEDISLQVLEEEVCQVI